MGSGEEEELTTAEEENSSEAPVLPPPAELPPPRADADWVGPLGKQIGNPDKACLGCLMLVVIAILVFIGCLVFYYVKNEAFHRS